MMMRLSDLCRIVGGELMGDDVPFHSVSIDTRSLHQGDLFVALKGERFDANEFIEQAEQTGAAAALLERQTASGLPQVVVADTRLALGRLGGAWRKRSSAAVIGVTGSNGKTTVKEMLAAVLSLHDPVLFTQGNLNNELGVPLTLLRLRPEHRYAVVEMGANHPGEIAYTSRLAQPDVALITNAGAAHLEGFGSVEGVARAKGELLASLSDRGTAVLNADDAFFDLWKTLAGERRVLTFGFSSHADVRAVEVEPTVLADGFDTCFSVEYEGQRSPMSLALAGRHNVCNALAATAGSLALGLGMEQIRAGLAAVRPVPGRMQPVAGPQGSVLVNDSYNANPSSFEAGLDVLVALNGEPWVIMGALGELGEESSELHARVGRMAKEKGVLRLFATGPDAEQAVAAFGEGGSFFSQPSDLAQAVRKIIHKDVVALVKGSRSQRLEQVIEVLTTEKAA
jgi:UDP-N-acetylmuramoyl-tripeptide--D-alanyl-D-alanine ligase